MAGSGPGDLFAAAGELLAASVEALDTIPTYEPTLDGAPDRAFITAGNPALDCCDQLTVDVSQVADAPTGPFGLAAGRKIAGKVNHVSLVVTITRCFPMPAQDGTPPPTADIEAAAEQIDADGWALWNHLYNLWRAAMLFTVCDEVFFDSLRPLGPSGGCAGWVLVIHISLDGYEEAITS